MVFNINIVSCKFAYKAAAIQKYELSFRIIRVRYDLPEFLNVKIACFLEGFVIHQQFIMKQNK